MDKIFLSCFEKSFMTVISINIDKKTMVGSVSPSLKLSQAIIWAQRNKVSKIEYQVNSPLSHQLIGPFSTPNTVGNNPSPGGEELNFITSDFGRARN